MTPKSEYQTFGRKPQMTMIPKTIHYCWFGGQSLPAGVSKYISTWKRQLPDYVLQIWNEDNFDPDMFRYSKEAYRMGSFAHVSDVCRIYALNKYGGIYLDTDIEVVASFDPFLHFKSFVGAESKFIGTGVIGAEADTDWLSAVLDYYRQAHFINIWGHAVHKPNTQLITKKILPALYVDTWPAIFPKDYFCANNWENGHVCSTINTVSIHHYEASWRHKKDIRERIVSIIKGLKVRYCLK